MFSSHVKIFLLDDEQCQVGSGKSSFLLGLIGELWAQGVMELERKQDKVNYAVSEKENRVKVG